MHPNTVDITGQRFGRLTVLSITKNRKGRAIIWKCQCDCGNIKEILGSELRFGSIVSCGCYRKEKTKEALCLPEGMAERNNLYRKYKDSAKKRKIKFNLSKEDFTIITSKNCYYCGTEPQQSYHRPDYNGEYVHNGIDRLDNEKGYFMENCVPCCKICNMAKGTKTVDEFIEWIKNVYFHFVIDLDIE